MPKETCPTCGHVTETPDKEPPPEDAHKAAGLVLVDSGDEAKARPGDVVQKGFDGIRRIYRKAG